MTDAKKGTHVSASKIVVNEMVAPLPFSAEHAAIDETNDLNPGRNKIPPSVISFLILVRTCSYFDEYIAFPHLTLINTFELNFSLFLASLLFTLTRHTWFAHLINFYKSDKCHYHLFRIDHWSLQRPGGRFHSHFDKS